MKMRTFLLTAASATLALSSLVSTSRASTQEYGVIALLSQELIQGIGSADHTVQADLDPQAANIVHFGMDDTLGQAKFGNAVNKHTARRVE